MDQVLKTSITCEEQYRVILHDFYKQLSHTNLDVSMFVQSSDLILIGLADVLASFVHKDVMQWYPNVLAIMLIHRGLQVHGMVPDVPVSLPEQERQLNVLAGDYFSSKYYRILVEHGNIPFVRYLARAIQTINESKVDLRVKERYQTTTFAEHVKSASKTPYELFVALCEYENVPFPETDQLIRTVSEILVLLEAYMQDPGQYVSYGFHERILWQTATPEERKHLKKLQYGQPFDGKVLSWFVKYNTRRVLELQIQERIQEVKSIFERSRMITGARFDEAFSHLIRSLEHELLRHRRVVEEV
jgi:heptaprenyl diphosphate synthase